MVNNTQIVQIEILRTLAHGSISGSYAAVGTPLLEPARIVCFTNNTDGDMLFSDDGVNDKLFVAAGSFKLFDFTTNKFLKDQMWVFAEGTQFWVKQSSAPSKNSVYIEALWGQ